MIYTENKNSSIDVAIRSLERAHQLRKEEFKSRKKEKGFSAGSLFSQPEPALQIKNVIKESEEVVKFVSERMQQEIKENPWAFLGKVAAVSIGLGLIAGYHLTPKSKARK